MRLFRPVRLRTFVVIAIVALAATTACSKSQDVPAPMPPLAVTDSQQGLTGPQRDSLHHLGEGDEFMPVAWLKSLNSVETGNPFLEHIERFGMIADPADSNGLPIGLSARKPTDLGRLSNKMVGFNCAACHTGQLSIKGTTIVLEGGRSHVDAESFERELMASVDALKDPKTLAAFIGRVRSRPKSERDLDSLDIRNIPNDLVAIRARMATFKALKALLEKTPRTESGYGRIDAFGTSRNLLYPDSPTDLTAPVRHPHVWEMNTHRFLHWDGNTNSVMERNIGQAVAAGAVFDPKSGLTTLLPENLYALETLVGRITAPKWPAKLAGPIDAALAARGSAIFAKECQSCHVMGHDTVVAVRYAGTDSMRSHVAGFPLHGKPYIEEAAKLLTKAKEAAYAAAHVTPERATQMENGHLPTIWRFTGGYVGRSLSGVWAFAPYLHNGSVPTLDDLLKPPAERPVTFTLGGYEFDPVKVGLTNTPSLGVKPFVLDTRILGNSNAGHLWGTQLSADERRALIEYMKTL